MTSDVFRKASRIFVDIRNNAVLLSGSTVRIICRLHCATGNRYAGLGTRIDEV